MFRVATAGVLMIIGLTSTGGVSPKLAGVVPDRPEIGFEVDIDDAGWAELVDWAVERYRSVGIELPSAIVSLSTDTTYCDGNAGLFIPGSVPEVRFCVTRAPTSKVSRLIVLHELGHLWAENSLSEAARNSFMAVRELTAWIDRDLPPHEWGAEHAAEVLSWGLMDEPVRIIRIRNAGAVALGEAFVDLTGMEPLVGEGDRSVPVG